MRKYLVKFLEVLDEEVLGEAVLDGEVLVEVVLDGDVLDGDVLDGDVLGEKRPLLRCQFK